MVSAQDIRNRMIEKGHEAPTIQAINDAIAGRSRSSAHAPEIVDAYLDVLEKSIGEHLAAVRAIHSRHVTYQLPRRGGKQVRAAQE